ncbi:MAG: hypothetical protein LUG98_09750 [Tannerellaceae bacterium]|nr:hypothetical protein [Tannerellaceae bacterium]
MKIIHSSGEPYDISPDTTLEMERTNPFFNEYGEQSLPITLPPTAWNRKLLSWPDDITGITKLTQRADATIQTGIFSIQARQAILSGNKKEGISTSFYLNTGAFYEKIQDVKLSSIFENKVISFSSISAAITFCRNLLVNYDERFAIFPVSTEDGTLNAYNTKASDGYYTLYNAESRTKEVDEKTIQLDAGYYISPFIRVHHLLSEIFSYFGYQYAENFLTKTEPFRSMVLLNTTIDTLMKSEIRYTQILPDCMVSEILNAFRGLFNCEFIPDEVNRKMHIVLFNEVMEAKPEADLTPYFTGFSTINHPETFKQLKLSVNVINQQTQKISSTRSGARVANTSSPTVNSESFSSLIDLLKKYPKAEYNPINGRFTRTGFKGTTKVIQDVGSIICDYMDAEKYEIEEKEVPVSIPTLKYSYVVDSSGRGNSASMTPILGPGRALNSTIVMDDAEDDADLSADNEDENLDIIPCFVYNKDGGARGTVLNYDYQGNKLWSYTLSFNGPDGLFEKFWRTYDTLLRNSLIEIQSDTLLPEVIKASLSGYKKILYQGQELLPDKIKFIPGKKIPQQCTFLTTKLYQPVIEATSEATRLANAAPIYEWTVNSQGSHATKTRYIFDEDPAILFYDPPTAAQYNAGGRYHQKTYAVQFYSRSGRDGPDDPEPGTLIVWLTAKRK